MTLNNFFKDVLGANLKNNRWSWGADNPLTNQCFLRVWEDEIVAKKGIKKVQILDRTLKKSHGQSERINQINEIKSGVEGFGVLCVAVDPNKSPRKIKSFDQNRILKLGKLFDSNQKIYAEIIEQISVSSIEKTKSSSSTLLPELKSLLIDNKNTENSILSKARIGQGKFRSDVLKLWNAKCCVTGTKINDIIKASHIKPWRKCNNSERLDPNNGLPLVANLDALFDAGLISFDEKGILMISNTLPTNEIQILKLDSNLRLQMQPNRSMKEYLDYHRNKILKQ